MSLLTAISQRPAIDSNDVIIPNLKSVPIGNNFNSSLDRLPWIPHQLPPSSSEVSPIFGYVNYGKKQTVDDIINSINTERPHPLSRYSQKQPAYYSDEFETSEYNRGLSYKDSVTKAILTSTKDSRKPLLLMNRNEDSDGKIQTINDTSSLYQPIGDAKPIAELPNISKVYQLDDFITEKSSTSNLSNATPQTGIKPKNPPIGIRESFTHPLNNTLDYTFIEVLKTRAMSLCYYLQNNKNYSEYASNWKLLEKNLQKSNYLFERLKETDQDIAYVINKGDEIKFRIRDSEKYIPLNTYQYVLYHEMAHMSTNELQHTKNFYKLLSILCFAAFENGFIDFSRLNNSYYKSNGQSILSKRSLQDEILEGAKLISKDELYIKELQKYISSK